MLQTLEIFYGVFKTHVVMYPQANAASKISSRIVNNSNDDAIIEKVYLPIKINNLCGFIVFE